MPKSQAVKKKQLPPEQPGLFDSVVKFFDNTIGDVFELAAPPEPEEDEEDGSEDGKGSVQDGKGIVPIQAGSGTNAAGNIGGAVTLDLNRLFRDAAGIVKQRKPAEPPPAEDESEVEDPPEK